MSKSENGWEPLHAGGDILNWVRVPGAEHVSLQFMKGWPTTILKAFAADFHAYVEPLRDGDSAAFTPTNSVATSNHLNGTAMDLNWNGADGRTFRLGISEAQAYPGDKAQKLRELLEFYEGMVFCGGKWSIRDWMHFQMGGNTWMNPKTQDFINRKIRADGFSTYKRSGAPVPPPVADGADILARATGLSADRAREILPAVVSGLKASDCTNVNRIAMWLAQIGHESGSFKYTEEIAKNGRYAPYIGRTWIQITWDYNYRAFSQWCHSKGMVPTPDYFVVNYRELADLKWAGIGPAWYWTVARPKINAQSDARDLYAVTQAINGGQNGAADRAARYERALALGDQLLTLTTSTPSTPGDDMAQVPQDQWDRVYRELTKLFESRSPFRPFDAQPSDTLAGFTLYADGNSHWPAVKAAAELGHPASLQLLQYIAAGDQARYPDRADDIKLAQAILADIQAGKQVANTTTGPFTAPDNSAELSALYAENARLREENARLQERVSQAPVSVELAAVAPSDAASTSGDIAGKVVDSLEGWTERVLSMDVKQRASLTKSLEALQLPNGTQP